LQAGIDLVDHIEKQGGRVDGKVFLEVGTGRRLSVPLALWLCGASKVITVDLNPYLETALVRKDMCFIRDNRESVRKLFKGYAERPVFRERFKALASQDAEDISIWMRKADIRYLAPADAANLDIPGQSVDYHVSFTVFEHIPPDTLGGIMREGGRVLKTDGLFVHYVDFSDHFSHSDKDITAVNFLQFDEEKWDRYAGNRYMWHNRLRIDEFLDLLKSSGLRVLSSETKVDGRSLDTLKLGQLRLDRRFKDKTDEANATSSAWIAATR
jgi:SAM-dependent methyltransferase